MGINYRELWAKTDPYKALWQHMLDVGYVAHALLTQTSYSFALKQIAIWMNCTPDEALPFVSYVAAVHDIGKCHPVFQGLSTKMEPVLRTEGLYQPELLGQHFRHESYSRIVLKRLMPRRVTSPTIRRLVPCIAGLHHQGKGNPPVRIYCNPEVYEQMQDELEAACYECFPFSPAVTLDNCEHTDAVCTILCALVILSDWIASGNLAETFIHVDAPTGAYARLVKEKAAAAVRECGFHKKCYLAPAEDYELLWKELKSPRPIQRTAAEVSARCPQLLIIEAPMGEGKTEAAILAQTRMAKGERGLYFALPTSATSNLMYERLCALFDEKKLPGIRLLHASAWLAEQPGISLSEQKNEDELSSWLLPLRRGLLEQNAVGTVDQAMLSVLRVKYGVLRLLGLMGKVLIIDEIHAYDMYMSTIIERLLSWCAELEVPVILLSATLPRKRREGLIAAYTGKQFASQSRAYPLITSAVCGEAFEEAAGEAHMRRVLQIERVPIMGDAYKIACVAHNKIEKGGCLCVIVNTIDMAQKVYRACKEIMQDDGWSCLLHSRFPAYKRDEIERECNARFGKHGDRPARAILVATQIVEQSCDYSFDYMISELAPIDLLLQRSGRLLRHEDGGLWGKVVPTLCVIVPIGETFGPSEFVYYPYLLKKTREFLNITDALSIPEDIRNAIETVYDTEPDDQQIEDWLARNFREEMQWAEANSVLLRPPDPENFGLYESVEQPFSDNETGTLRAMTRLAEPSRRAILLSEGEMPTVSEMERMPLSHVQELFRMGLSLRESQLIDTAAEGYCAPLIGQGKLRGCVLYPMADGRYEGRHGEKEFRYILDEKLGLIIEKGGE